MTATAVAPSAIAGEAHAVLHLALGLTWPEDRETGRAVGRAVWGLHDALVAFAVADLNTEALAKAAAGAEDSARVLIRLIAEHCGDEAAALAGTGTAA